MHSCVEPKPVSGRTPRAGGSRAGAAEESSHRSGVLLGAAPPARAPLTEAAFKEPSQGTGTTVILADNNSPQT